MVPLFVLEQDAPAWFRDNYGLVQRMFFAFDFWCAYLALALLHSVRQPAHTVDVR